MARLKVFRDDNFVRDKADHPVAAACAHPVAIARLARRAGQHASVEGTGRRERETPGRIVCTSRSVRAAATLLGSVWVKTSAPVLDTWNGITCHPEICLIRGSRAKNYYTRCL